MDITNNVYSNVKCIIFRLGSDLIIWMLPCLTFSNFSLKAQVILMFECILICKSWALCVVLISFYFVLAVFKTSTNQSVIQTYNATTYKNCSIDYSEDDDTFSYTTGNNEFNQSLTIAIPLTINGTNYYFSDSDDGVQCEKGMAFEIDVKYGSGLPPSLNQPPPPAYVEPSPPVPGVTIPPPSTGVRATIANLPWLLSFITICGMMVLMEWVLKELFPLSNTSVRYRTHLGAK